MQTMQIWKFPLRLEQSQTIEMPGGAEVLGVADQKGVICIWAMVIVEATKSPRTFEIHGTGHPIDEDVEYGRRFVGTVFQGNFVWHVFEIV